MTLSIPTDPLHAAPAETATPISNVPTLQSLPPHADHAGALTRPHSTRPHSTLSLPGPPAPPHSTPPLPGAPTLPHSSAPHLLWGQDQLLSAAPTSRPWLWPGFLLPGALTVLTSFWKSGKTTLVSILLAKRNPALSAPALGAPALSAPALHSPLTLAPGNSIVVSEESPDHWHRRTGHLDFGNHVGWFCRPFPGRPTPSEWTEFVGMLPAVCASRQVDLVVIDTLAAFMHGGENDAGSMMDVLTPLQRLTSLGISVLLLHHPRKSKASAGQAARGSGALTAFADILIEMHWYGRPAKENRARRLQVFSRYADSPSEMVIELSADGTDYVGHGPCEQADLAIHWPILQTVLDQAANPLSRADIHRHWPGPKPDPTRLHDWLEQAVDNQQLRRGGKGVKRKPFTYWLPAKESLWLKDPMAFVTIPELFDVTGL